MTAIRPGSATKAPSVPPLPSGQTRRNSALMRATLYTPPQLMCSAALSRSLNSGLDKCPSRKVGRKVCATPRRRAPAARSNAARWPRRARAGSRRRSRCDLERPVRALQREQLPQRARAGVRAQRLQLGAALGPREAAGRGRAPGAQVAPVPQLVGGTSAGAAAGLGDADGHDVRELQHALEERHALVPVVAEQLGVEGDDGALGDVITNACACARARAWPRSGS